MILTYLVLSLLLFIIYYYYYYYYCLYIGGGALGQGTLFVAKQRYDAIGHRQTRVLAFDKGEELEVMNPVLGSDWWEATSLRTGKQGEVPSSYLTKKPEDQLPHFDQMR